MKQENKLVSALLLDRALAVKGRGLEHRVDREIYSFASDPETLEVINYLPGTVGQITTSPGRRAVELFPSLHPPTRNAKGRKTIC